MNYFCKPDSLLIMKNYLLLCLLTLTSVACNTESKKPVATSYQDSNKIKVLEKIPSTQTGLYFNNKVVENGAINSIAFEGFTQGAGVACLDINNDGLMDIFFSGNMVPDKLFLNKGDMKFEDVTAKARILGQNWSTGASVVDINNDGFDDLYVCKFLYDESARRTNLFYINNKNGTFTEQAVNMGVADQGYSVMSNFLDFDNDGDLDLYVANQPPNSIAARAPLKGKRDFRFTDRLYRNDGGKFTDITQAAGITNYTYSLSSSAFDYNSDGHTDLYVACDFDEPDILYKNNGDGTFTNVAAEALKHMSYFSMGSDVADINNDGQLDVYVVDMVAEDNYRQKTNMSGMNPKKFWNLANNGYHYQYMYNAMHLNNGDDSFSEISQLSGISNTDWSWSPLFVDLDNDSYKDLIVTNGLIIEIRNKDFELWKKDYIKKLKETAKANNTQASLDPLVLSKKAPRKKIKNYVYKNNGDMTFSKQNENWGFTTETWSHGSAYADFDNDGDLDLVINNMNMEADFYKNMSSENNLNNYINIKLSGSKNNIDGLNARIKIKHGDQSQLIDHTPYRGYMSTSEKVSHFGVGLDNIVSEIIVTWADQKETILRNVNVNQTITISHKDASSSGPQSIANSKIFKPANPTQISYVENTFDDYAREILLPYQTSTLGPILAVADVDGDGREDIYLGGAVGQSGTIMINKGTIFDKVTKPFARDKGSEDGAAHFYDYDGDGDLDLYVSSGGSEYQPSHKAYQDRLYKNDGKGNFTKTNALPKIDQSTASVISLDYDEDGDLDLFVGGRLIPGNYGHKPKSYLLRNDQSKYKDVSESQSELFDQLGMITDIISSDINSDGKEEIIVAGEWMPILVLAYDKKGLHDVTSDFGLDKRSGWWNTVEIADVDGDGDQDIIGGNLGHNIKYKASESEPFTLYVDDFDNNGTNDVYLGYYQDGVCYPVRGRQCSSQQMPFISEKYESYSDFGLASIDKILDDRVSSSTNILKADLFASTVFINEGGRFSTKELPSEVQISPVYGIAVDDFDKDGKVDIFLAGNMYNREVETVRSDAGKGCMVTIDNNGKFKVISTTKTGISADKDVRAIELIKGSGTNLMAIANNNAPMQFYSY